MTSACLLDRIGNLCVTQSKKSDLIYSLFRKKGYEDLNANHFPKFFEFFENNLKKNSSQEYIHGDNLTIADFAHLSVYSSMINNGANKDSSMSILEDFPTLKNYYLS